MHNLDNWVRHIGIAFLPHILILANFILKTSLFWYQLTLKLKLTRLKWTMMMNGCYCWWWASLQSKNNNFVTRLLWPAPLCTFPFPTMPVNTEWKQSSIPNNHLSTRVFDIFFAISYSLLISVVFVNVVTNMIFLKWQKRKKKERKNLTKNFHLVSRIYFVHPCWSKLMWLQQ